MAEKQVVAVKSVTGCGPEGWSEDKLLPGDIVDQLRAQRNILVIASAPFNGGKNGLQRELRKIHQAQEVVVVRIKRAGNRVEVRAIVIAEESIMKKKVYLLADCNHKSYVVHLMDATEDECLALQDQTRKTLEKQKKSSNITAPAMKNSLLSYSWKTKMQQFLPAPSSSMVFSLILMPAQEANRYGNLEDTTARAMTWLAAAQSSGVPVNFVNIQSEPLFVQSSTSRYFASGSGDVVEMVNSGMQTLHDTEGTDINVSRAVRLWYAPSEGELAITLQPRASEARLGVNITCTEEGFCYVASVEEGTAADRAGLIGIFEAARAAEKKLVVSRVAGEKITPWFVASSGAIRCFNAVSVGEKIAGHREVQQPIDFFFMVWTGATGGRHPSSNHENSFRQRSRSTYSESSDSGRFSIGSNQSLTAKTFSSNGSWDMVTNNNAPVASRSVSTKSFSFSPPRPEAHSPRGPAGHEDFTFML